VMLTDWPAWRSLRASLLAFPRLSCTFTTSAQYHYEPWPSWPRDIPARAERSERISALLHLRGLPTLHPELLGSRGLDQDCRGRAPDHVRGRGRDGGPEHPLRRTDSDAIYISISDNLPAEAFLEAIEDARQAAHRDHGLELWWIFDIPADFGIPAAELTASVALDHDVPGLVGFGLGGAEALSTVDVS
jgi:hypothetical protein